MIHLSNDGDLAMELCTHIAEQFDLANGTFAFITGTGGSLAVMEKLMRRLDPPLQSYSLKSRLDFALDSTPAYSCGCPHIISGFNARLGCELTDSNVLDVIFSDNSDYLHRLIRFFGIAFARGDGMATTPFGKVMKAGAKLGSEWAGCMESFLTGFLSTLTFGHTPDESCDSSTVEYA